VGIRPYQRYGGDVGGQWKDATIVLQQHQAAPCDIDGDLTVFGRGGCNVRSVLVDIRMLEQAEFELVPKHPGHCGIEKVGSQAAGTDSLSKWFAIRIGAW